MSGLSRLVWDADKLAEILNLKEGFVSLSEIAFVLLNERESYPPGSWIIVQILSLIEKGSTKAVRLDKLQITKSNLTESVCSFHPAHRLILLMVLTPHVEPHLNLN